MEGERAHGAVPIGAAQSVEHDRSDAEVRVEREDDGDAVARRRGIDADVAEIAGGEEALDRALHVPDRQWLADLHCDELIEGGRINGGVGTELDACDDRSGWWRDSRCGNRDRRRRGNARGTRGRQQERIAAARPPDPTSVIAPPEASLDVVLVREAVVA